MLVSTVPSASAVLLLLLPLPAELYLCCCSMVGVGGCAGVRESVRRALAALQVQLARSAGEVAGAYYSHRHSAAAAFPHQQGQHCQCRSFLLLPRLLSPARRPLHYSAGIIATIALVLINLVSRDDLAEIADSGEEGGDVSAGFE